MRDFSFMSFAFMCLVFTCGVGCSPAGPGTQTGDSRGPDSRVGDGASVSDNTGGDNTGGDNVVAVGDEAAAGDAFAGDTVVGDTAGGDSNSGDIQTTGDAAALDPFEPILFVHGVNGSADNWTVMIDRLVADGWPRERLYANTFADPQWGCNVDNADSIKTWVDEIIAETGAARVDLVAHSMGSLSSRYYMKTLGGHDLVGTYVTLGGMHHGLFTPCLSPAGLQCTWDELCAVRAFIGDLNSDPVTPGPAQWVSMYGTADSTVPNNSSNLDGAENIEFAGVEHDGPQGLLQTQEPYDEVVRVLAY